ncbi:NAD(P)-binding protein [Streptomyces sp. NPDC059788]|uniref:NAD(P)-binding protein n=1 Tax=Streptomyces sp. NPDC059788 TaxID=3346948 RepID=UPI00365EA56D
MRRPHITVIGGGFAGLTAAISSAEGNAAVTLYEAHSSLGGRARTAERPYRTNEGPHALYNGGPHWTWLKQRGLLKPLAPLPPLAATRIRFHRHGTLRRIPPAGLIKLRGLRNAPVDQDFFGWATAQVGEEAARDAAHYIGVATFHHAPGLLSAAFVQERLRRTTTFPPEAHYIQGGWGELITRMADRAAELGVRIETGARIDALPEGGPVIVATHLESARALLKDDRLTWPSARTALLDVALRARRGDLFTVSGLDFPGWVERFTAQDRSLAPNGEELLQCQVGIGPDENRADGLARAECLLDAGFPQWRERLTWRRDALALGRTGAVDLPGTTWRDRPSVDRGNGVYLAGDQVAAPGVLSEVSFGSALEASALALRSIAGKTCKADRTGEAAKADKAGNTAKARVPSPVPGGAHLRAS